MVAAFSQLHNDIQKTGLAFTLVQATSTYNIDMVGSVKYGSCGNGHCIALHTVYSINVLLQQFLIPSSLHSTHSNVDINLFLGQKRLFYISFNSSK
jgi:hypothetical protein